jgi:hypothetical protein
MKGIWAAKGRLQGLETATFGETGASESTLRLGPTFLGRHQATEADGRPREQALASACGSLASPLCLRNENDK